MWMETVLLAATTLRVPRDRTPGPDSYVRGQNKLLSEALKALDFGAAMAQNPLEREKQSFRPYLQGSDLHEPE